MKYVLAILASMVLAGNAIADPPGSGEENGNGCVENCGNQGGDGGHGGHGGISDVDVDTTAVAVAEQSQKQAQGQFQAQGNSQNLTIEDAKNPAASAANLYLANCTSGASAQGFGGGGSLGGPDDVCLLLNFAQVAATFGTPEDAAWALGEAKNILKVRTNSFRRVLQAIPLVGRIM